MRSLKAGGSQTQEGQDQGQIFFEKEILRLVRVPTETSPQRETLMQPGSRWATAVRSGAQDEAAASLPGEGGGWSLRRERGRGVGAMWAGEWEARASGGCPPPASVLPVS